MGTMLKTRFDIQLLSGMSILSGGPRLDFDTWADSDPHNLLLTAENDHLWNSLLEGATTVGQGSTSSGKSAASGDPAQKMDKSSPTSEERMAQYEECLGRLEARFNSENASLREQLAQQNAHVKKLEEAFRRLGVRKAHDQARREFAFCYGGPEFQQDWSSGSWSKFALKHPMSTFSGQDREDPWFDPDVIWLLYEESTYKDLRRQGNQVVHDADEPELGMVVLSCPEGRHRKALWTLHVLRYNKEPELSVDY
ncbi:hypothetical protein CALCODRAFT_508249 [Calocera cornea HHB12733]|uniref:Uncharacterized protein n=1 Tax=Calocera cornea HHB12733 TaxID=1353952 RepID=A0A165GLH5_9BASI|nr:hypothetical protein CALCODRAFT_508249 [Calocera cornea HHB12733]